jgi:hypothetical protein
MDPHNFFLIYCTNFFTAAKLWDPDSGNGSDLTWFSDFLCKINNRFSHPVLTRMRTGNSIFIQGITQERIRLGCPGDAWSYLWYPLNTGFDLIVAECNNCKLVRGENRTLEMHMVILKSCKLPTWLHYQAPFYLLEDFRLFCSLTGPLDTALMREVVLSCWDEEVEIALV